MGAPYGTQAITGFDSNPPPDDGSETEANRVKWSTIKTKLASPVKDRTDAMDSAIIAAFARVLGGNSITSTAVSYQVLSTDQGKLVKATASGVTITTPDATDVDDPFIFGVLDNSSGTITLDGFGSQTIDGAASITLGSGQGCLLITDGSNWNTFGLASIPAGNQMGAGTMLNGTIAESNATNAVTFAIKTLAGADPSTSAPVVVTFRNATAGNGNYVYRTITSALSITIPSTGTMGFTNGVAGKLWLELFDDGGTIRLGVINCLSGTSIYPLGQFPIASSTQIGTGSDNVHVFYTNGAAVTSKPYIVIGYASYESGLAAAGSWNVSPTRLHLQGPCDPLPGQIIQRVRTATAAYNAGTTGLPYDDSIPQNTEGDQLMTLAVTPTSVANLLRITGTFFASADSANPCSFALFQDSTAAALVCGSDYDSTGSGLRCVSLDHEMLAGTTSSTTFKIRGGAGGGGRTMYFNGASGARIFGGVCNSRLTVEEFMA